MPGKWQIINGVKYPVEDHASPTPHEDEEVYLPRSYWKARAQAQAQKEVDAAITIQKYARRIIVYQTIEFPVDLFIEKEWAIGTCSMCGLI